MNEINRPKQDAQKASNQPKLTELSPEQLEKVSGGACVKGEHLKEATITVRSTGNSSSSSSG